jgi:hypothetical protein
MLSEELRNPPFLTDSDELIVERRRRIGVARPYEAMMHYDGMTWPRVDPTTSKILRPTRFANRYPSRIDLRILTNRQHWHCAYPWCYYLRCELAVRPCRVPSDNNRGRLGCSMFNGSLDAGVIGSTRPKNGESCRLPVYAINVHSRTCEGSLVGCGTIHDGVDDLVHQEIIKKIILAFGPYNRLMRPREASRGLTWVI